MKKLSFNVETWNPQVFQNFIVYDWSSLFMRVSKYCKERGFRISSSKERDPVVFRCLSGIDC